MPSRADTLQEAVHSLKLNPFETDDSFYVDLTKARGNKILARLERHFSEAAEQNAAFTHVAFIGHRGSGKSTELLHLEKRLSNTFYPIHLALDPALHGDADYPDLLLWLVEQVTQRLGTDKIPLDPKHVQNVADWFWEVTKFKTDKKQAETEIKAQVEAGAKYMFFGTGCGSLTKLTSAFKGSSEQRVEMRKELEANQDELLVRVNLFLDEVRLAIQAAGRPARLLLVQDNLDRLAARPALRLFRDNASILKSLRVDCIWTAPVGTQLHPYNIGRNFETFNMPTIAVRNKHDKKQDIAIEGLAAVIDARMNVDLTFETIGVLHILVLASGGSLRDLIRLVDSARLTALVEEHDVILEEDAQAAVKDFAVNMQRVLIPTNVYFPILAEIAVEKEWETGMPDTITPGAVSERIGFFHQLIVEGIVLEYNGDGLWYDVHPALHALESFSGYCDGVKKTFSKRKPTAGKPAKAHGKTSEGL